MDEEHMYAPYTVEPNAEGLSPDTELVAIDNRGVVYITPDPDIKHWKKGLWHKEIVITYTLIHGSPGEAMLASDERLTNDKSWIQTVWNNMGRHYSAFLKRINTTERTLRFSVLTDEDYKRLERRAVKSVDELQNEMFKDTGRCLDGVRLKAIADTDTLSNDVYTDSGLGMDSIMSLSAGQFTAYFETIISLVHGLKEDLDDIKLSTSKLRSCVHDQKPQRISLSRRSNRSHSYDKHTHRQSSNGIHELTLTSTDEDTLFALDTSTRSNGLYGIPSDREEVWYQDQPSYPYGHVKNRNNRDSKHSFSTLQQQEIPGGQYLRSKRDTHALRYSGKERIILSDDDFDSDYSNRTQRTRRATQLKLKPDQSKHKKKLLGRLEIPLRSKSLQHDTASSMSRSGVKVLNPRSVETEHEQRPTKSNLADNEIQQYGPKESTTTGQHHDICRSEIASQIPTVGLSRHLLQSNKGQNVNEDIPSQDNQQQLEVTERHGDIEHGSSMDDKLLLEKTIREMEQSGDVNLETDGINDPALLLQMLSPNKGDETEDTGKNEDVKKEQDKAVVAERIPQGGEHDDSAAMDCPLDTGSEANSPNPCEGQGATGTTTPTSELDFDNDVSVSTITTEDPGWSIESGYSSLPDVDPKTMLRRVGLDTNELLIQVLNQSKTSIEDSSHEAKGNGIDTVLLVDASSSMDEKSFDQMKSACLNIVEFIETVAAEKGIEENLALVVFGRNPMILQHLTLDYRKLYDKIETIEPGGSSPMCIGMLLCMMELHLRGGTTSIARYQIAPRVIVLTDGRPTDDNRFQHQEIEFGLKAPTVKENVLLAMDEMRHHCYKVVCVPVGQAINRSFLADMVDRADGYTVEIDDLSNIKKHFICHYTIAKVIGVCRDTGREDQFKEVVERETATLLSTTLYDVTFTAEDVTMIKTELEKSEELKDMEYPDLNLPPIGSRVSIPVDPQSSHSRLSKDYGTVIQQKSTGMVKVEWDAGMITFLDYSTDRTNTGIDVVPEPRRHSKGSLIDVGVEVTKVHTVTEEHSETVRGRVFLTTNNGYVKVRWDDGTIGRHRFGADATFDLCITLESYPIDEYVWQYEGDGGDWVTYPLEDLQKLNSAFIKRSKTVTTRSGRIVIAAMTETQTHGARKKRNVRRITVDTYLKEIGAI